MGVAEHVFDVNIHGKNVTWHLYDVGGARGQRHSWVPYFDDANAIIFVAPISAFDQVSMLVSSEDVNFLGVYIRTRSLLISLGSSFFLRLMIHMHSH